MARRAIKTAKPRMWALWNENKKLSMKLCSLQSFTRNGKRRSGDIAAAYKVFARFGSKNESCYMGKIIVQWRMKTFVWFMPPRADSLRVQSIVKQLRAHDGMSKLTAVEASAYWISLLISIDYSRHRITLCLHRHHLSRSFNYTLHDKTLQRYLINRINNLLGWNRFETTTSACLSSFRHYAASDFWFLADVTTQLWNVKMELNRVKRERHRPSFTRRFKWQFFIS